MANQLIPQDFEIVSGDNSSVQFDVTNQSGAVVDITSATATWALARRNHSTTLVSKTVGDGITIVDGPNGVLLVSLDQTDTASLSGDYYHELQIVQSSGRKTTAAYGTASVLTDLIQ